MTIQIINLYKATKEEISISYYVGRNSVFYAEKFGFTKWIPELANPYVVGKHGKRGECVELYRKYLAREIKNNNRDIIDALLQIPDDAKLACFCAPAKCHVEIIIRARDWLIKNAT